MPNELKEDLRQMIADKKVVMVVGSGVSIAATKNAPAASWGGLLQLGVERCRELNSQLDEAWAQGMRKQIASGDLVEMLLAAENISCRLGAPEEGEFRRWLRETVGALKVRDSGVLEALRDLRVPLGTTNYDHLLSQVIRRPPVTWRDQAEVSRLLRGESESILHLHGQWAQPESVVLGTVSYEAIRRDAHAQAAFRTEAMTRNLVFVGCGEGLSDPDFQPFFAWLREVGKKHEARHYRLIADDELAKVRQQRSPERLRLLSYGSDHTALAGFLAELAPRARARATAGRSKVAVGKSGRAASPTLSPAILAYLQRLETATARLQLVGIGRGLQIELPIEQAYIPLNVLAQGGLADGQPDHLDPKKLAAGRREDSPVELAQVFEYAARRGHRGVVLLGDPGAGKTTGARQFCWRVLQAPMAARTALGLPGDVIPVFLRLRHLKAEHTSLKAFICESVAAPSAPDDLAQPGPDLWDRREHVLWVFDGLDEVVDEALRIRVAGWIQRALTERPRDYFLVTSRYQGQVNLGASFCLFQVRPLEGGQVAAFVSHWYRAVFRCLHDSGAGVERQADQQSRSLIAILDQSDYRVGSLRALRANPLMLTIICVVHHEDKNLPHRRADLYARCVRVLVEHWRRELRETAGLAHFNAGAAESVLAKVAWWLHGTENRATATVAALGTVAGRALAGMSANAGLGRDGGRFIARMRDESGILAWHGDGQTGFLHLTFQEYLAGDHAHREGREAELVRNFGSKWWREVTLIAVALGSEVFAHRFFKALLRTPALGTERELFELCLKEAQHKVLQPFLAELRAPQATAARQLAILRLLTDQDQPGLLQVCRKLADGRNDEVAALAREILQRATGETQPAAAPRVVVGGETFVDPRTGIAFVGIPAGEFAMGSAKGGYDDERPMHQVRISSGFLLGKYPVTNAEYQRYLEANPKAKPPGEWTNSQFNEPQQPVVGVSWHDAQKFCQWAGCRLPTEAEWEYACRAKSRGAYCFGSTEAKLKTYAWYGANSGNKTHAVGRKKPNAWGLYDMHGNVWEWCQDVWDAEAYRKRIGGVADPVTAASADEDPPRVLRGGSWLDSAGGCRSAFRDRGVAVGRIGNFGFRVCLARGPAASSPISKPASA